MNIRLIMIAGLAAGGALMALSGCQTAKINPTAGGGGLQGRWLPASGGYTASFDNGAFSTVANDTGNVISQGSYIAVSEKRVELNWSSNITGLQNTAVCDRPNPDTLNCSDGGGKGFVLTRT